MASQTTNLGLTLPAGSENVSRNVINGNMELIDEAYGTMEENVDYLMNGGPLYDFLITREFTKTYSISANQSIRFARSDFNFTVPSGYLIAGIASWYSGSQYVNTCYVRPDSSDYFMAVQCQGTAPSGSVTARVTVLFVKEVNLPG